MSIFSFIKDSITEGKVLDLQFSDNSQFERDALEMAKPWDISAEFIFPIRGMDLLFSSNPTLTTTCQAETRLSHTRAQMGERSEK